MVEKGTFSWKGFYNNERKLKAEEISRRIEELKDSKDPEVLKVIEKGGVLSFPHTVLDGSLDPVIRIAKALIDSKKDKVIALAVVHYGNHGPSDEFSLDTFLYVMDEMKKRFGLDLPEVEALYPPDDKSPYKDLDDRMNRSIGDAEKIKDRIDGSTAIVITGDLCHYGNFYKRTSEMEDYRKQIDIWVEESMDLLYHKGDYLKYLGEVRKSGNDQFNLAIMVKHLLGKDLDYKFFQKKITDYSKILDEPPPVLVASYFYGVWKR